jgi:hypothetical protein
MLRSRCNREWLFSWICEDISARWPASIGMRIPPGSNDGEFLIFFLRCYLKHRTNSASPSQVSPARSRATNRNEKISSTVRFFSPWFNKVGKIRIRRLWRKRPPQTPLRHLFIEKWSSLPANDLARAIGDRRPTRCKCIKWPDIKSHEIRSVASRSRRVIIKLNKLFIHS